MNVRLQLKTRRLILEPLESAHAEVLFESLQDIALYRFIPQEPPDSPETLGRRYCALSTGASPSRHELWGNWAMRLRHCVHYVGLVEATISTSNTAFIAYVTFQRFWRQGFAFEALKALLTYLAENTPVDRFVAEVDSRNNASYRLLEKLGFTRKSEKQRVEFFKDSWSDEYRYELVRENLVKGTINPSQVTLPTLT